MCLRFVNFICQKWTFPDFDNKINVISRVRPIYEKLTDQVPDGAKVRYSPKGQLGEISANLGENCNGEL